MPDQITIIMEGGVIQEILNIPQGTNIVVKDYDSEMYDIDELETDEHGDEYKEIVFSN